jgi:hypothetical protein
MYASPIQVDEEESLVDLASEDSFKLPEGAATPGPSSSGSQKDVQSDSTLVKRIAAQMERNGTEMAEISRKSADQARINALNAIKVADSISDLVKISLDQKNSFDLAMAAIKANQREQAECNIRTDNAIASLKSLVKDLQDRMTRGYRDEGSPTKSQNTSTGKGGPQRSSSAEPAARPSPKGNNIDGDPHVAHVVIEFDVISSRLNTAIYTLVQTMTPPGMAEYHCF